MNCKRCKGLCISDYVEERGRFFAVGRCINCGSVVFPQASEQKPVPVRLVKNKAEKHSKTRPHNINNKLAIEKICA